MDLHLELDAFYQEALRLKMKGNAAEAEAMETKAAQFLGQLKNYTEQHPDDDQTATYLLFLAEREWSIVGDDEKVQTLIQQALANRESRLGAMDPAVAEALTQLAEFHFLAGRFGEAEPLYRRANAIYERCETATSAAFAKCQGGLARTLAALGRLADADPFFASAIELSKGREESKRMLYFLYTYRAEGLEKQDRGGEAEALRRRAMDLLPRNNPGQLGFHV
jgi:tetratricopeptide (TPR) repeat protein